MIGIFLVTTLRMHKAKLHRFEDYLNNAGYYVIMGKFANDYLFKDFNKGDLPAFDRYTINYCFDGKDEGDLEICSYEAQKIWEEFEKVDSEMLKQEDNNFFSE